MRPAALLPALFTRPSRRPHRAMAALTNRSRSAGRVTSACTASASPPASRSRCSVAASRPESRPQTATRAPSSTRRSASAAPSPSVPPVISTTLPFRCRSIALLSRQARQVLILPAVEDQRPQVVVGARVRAARYAYVSTPGPDRLADAGFDPAPGAFERDGAVLGDPPVQSV